MPYHCAVCGELHGDLPDIGADKPDHWWSVAEEEREKRVELTSDMCIIDDEHFFIRGVIHIPVHECPQGFGIGVWVSQKRENFFTYRNNFDDSSEVGPFFGWLCTRIHYYEDDTRLLKTTAIFRGGKSRPAIELHSSDHPLAVDQRNGITLAKAWEIVHFYQQK